MQSPKKSVVYTVLTGDVHVLIDPFPPGSSGYDRICFTQDGALRSDSWEVRVFDSRDLEPERECRRPKLAPHRFLPEYEWSLYVDNRLRFRSDPREIFEAYGSESEFVCFRHPDRDCAYEEAEVVIERGYEKEWRVREQMDHYRRHGFPQHAGLAAGTMLLRRHNSPRIVALDEEWFEHVLRFSRRDQLSLDFCAWRHDLRYGTFSGGLRQNELIRWPCVDESSRIPADFDEDVYTWLNPEVVRSALSPRQHFLSEGRKRKLRYRRPPRCLNRLANKYKSDKGDLYFNAHGYADVYEHYLAELRTAPIRLLEIGLLRHDVQARNPGGPYDDAPSLCMWREYFERASLIGFDIADFSRAPDLRDCQILRGDMSKPEDLMQAVAAAGGALDVIIDDASHASHHQQIALRTLFTHLKRGGLYFVEDLHYQPSALERSKAVKTRDMLEEWSRGRSVPSEFISTDEQERILDQLEFVRFYDSQERFFGALKPRALAVLRKTEGMLGRLGRLIK